MTKKITIAGLGYVGGAIFRYFDEKKLSPRAYDPPKGKHDTTVLEDADIIFIAVPTPYTKAGFDLSYVNEVLPLVKGSPLVVIKSTVLPGTTDTLQSQFPKLRFVFNPEFLTQNKAYETLIHPTRQIIGYTKISRSDADEILKLLPHAPYKKAMRATEAEMIKYMNNAFYAMKVTYANQIYDLCEALNIDYDAVSEGATSNEPWMGTNHWDVFFGEYRGYGGKCFPKDVLSLIQLGKQNNVDVSLLEKMEELNSRRTTNT